MLKSMPTSELIAKMENIAGWFAEFTAMAIDTKQPECFSDAIDEGNTLNEIVCEILHRLEIAQGDPI